MTYLRSFYLTNRVFVLLGGVAVLYVAAFFVPALTFVARAALVLVVAGTVMDAGLLFAVADGLSAQRGVPNRFSNGDNNPVTITLVNRYRFSVRVTVIDELPVQLQVRDEAHIFTIPAGRTRRLTYTVRPVERGVYTFGVINAYVAGPLGLVQRRYQGGEADEVATYPSFVQMRKYTLLALSDRLDAVGVKKVRRVGHTMEFDHIREYVIGDDYRTVNWKATARRGNLMVNQYREERGQPVYSVINMGRVMEMPFKGMTLLDYSINASLALSNVAMAKDDRAGVITFSNTVGAIVPASRRSVQRHAIMETLYHVETGFLEADYARLASYIRSHVRQRSLLVLFTNFEALASLERQLAYLQALARQHVVVVIIFENTELHALIEHHAETVEEIYIKTIAETFAQEKRTIVDVLRKHGIYAVLTPPQDLTVQTINQYVTLKARGVF